jgi:hypothetical protein
MTKTMLDLLGAALWINGASVVIENGKWTGKSPWAWIMGLPAVVWFCVHFQLSDEGYEVLLAYMAAAVYSLGYAIKKKRNFDKYCDEVGKGHLKPWSPLQRHLPGFWHEVNAFLLCWLIEVRWLRCDGGVLLKCLSVLAQSMAVCGFWWTIRTMVVNPMNEQIWGWSMWVERNLHFACWFGGDGIEDDLWGNDPESRLDQFLRNGKAGSWGGRLHFPSGTIQDPGRHRAAARRLGRTYVRQLKCGWITLGTVIGIWWMSSRSDLALDDVVMTYLCAVVLVWIASVALTLEHLKEISEYLHEQSQSRAVGNANEGLAEEVKAGGPA